MDQVREKLYAELFAQSANTPLIPYEGPVPHNNSIWIKRECDNPFGSHYDRVYARLFFDLEKKGEIAPGDKVLETTSGSAGVSFAGIGKSLGYECFVALPAGGEKAREDAITKYLPDRDHLIFTPAEEYIAGFPGFVKRYLVENRDMYFLNHSMGKAAPGQKDSSNNESTLRAVEAIAAEVLHEKFDYFIPAIGNGSSALGMGRKLKPQTKIIAYESFQSAAAFELMYPGQYEKRFGIKPGTLRRHRLPGTSYYGIDFPHIKNAVEQGILDEVVLVSDERSDREYFDLTNQKSHEVQALPHWDAEIDSMGDLGRTTKAGLAVALQLSESVEGKKFLIIGYDKLDRYDADEVPAS